MCPIDVFVCVHAFKLPLYGTRITIMATDAVS